MKLTACYIVKDEETVLKRSIDSLREACDEIIVVDTGSKDNTVRIAQDAGAQVLHFDWCNDFSKARNHAIAHATGDAILFIDADEYFQPKLQQAHKAMIEGYLQRGETVFKMRIINLLENSLPTSMYLIRGFQNFIGLHYENPVHEQLNKLERQFNLPDEHFTLYHSGYLGDYSRKVSRNLDLLLAQIDPKTDKAQNPVTYFYIARESNQSGNQKQAQAYINRFFESTKEYTYPAHLWISAHKLRAKLAILDAIDLYSDSERKSYLKAYLDQFPRHPIPWMFKALYAFEFEGNLEAMHEAYKTMVALQEVYDESQYPGDFASIAPEQRVIDLSRGAAAFLQGDALAAMDAYITEFRRSKDTSVLNYLLRIIENQPSNDIAAFLQSLFDQPDASAYEKLLNVLIYYPEKKDLYLYFSKKLLQTAKQHSDLSAVASLLLQQYEHAVKIAQETSDAHSLGNTLLCTAVFCAQNPSLLQGIPCDTYTKRVTDAYFSGQPMQDIKREEWVLIAMIYKQLLFLQDADAIARMDQLLAAHPFLRFSIKSGYYNVPCHYKEVLDCFDIDTNGLLAAQIVFCYNRLAQAHIGLRQYDHALANFENMLSISRNYDAVRRDIGIIQSLSPAHGERIRNLRARYEFAKPLPMDRSSEEWVNSMFARSIFVAPELGRLTMYVR